MGALGTFGEIARGVGQAGSDVGRGYDYALKQKREAMAQQLEQIRTQLQMAELKSRLQESHLKDPSAMKKAVESAMGRSLTNEESQRLFGIQPPIPKSKYTSMRYDDKGKLWGLNTESGVEEPIPTSGEFKAPERVKASPFGKIDPVIAAQIGSPPSPAKFPQGEDDPAFKAQAKLWGVNAEKIRTRMAQAGAAARGAAYQLNRPAGYITPEGELVTATGGTAIARGYVPAAPGFQAMSKQSQFTEMQSASGKLRDAITALQPGDAWGAPQVAQMVMAMRAPDESTLSAVTTNLMASGLNERQQWYVIWLTQMSERILSLRNVAGMGQGAQDLRAAITSTIPYVTSGNKEFALRKLDAVDNQISQLYQGIPKVRGMKQGTTNTAPDKSNPLGLELPGGR